MAGGRQGKSGGRQGKSGGQRGGRRRRDEAVYVISVAAELAEMHPQTLRSYERQGLVNPARTSGNVRKYSERDVARLSEIQRLTQDEGLNLAGVKLVLELRARLEEADERIAELEVALEELSERLREEVEAAHRSHRYEIVPLRRAAIELYARSRRPFEDRS